MDLNDVKQVVNTEKATALSLSKGGWEGWLQCELWSYLSLTKKTTVEREVLYPNSDPQIYCDLVVGATAPQLWVELKAFGFFRENDVNRFLDGVAQDVHKLTHQKPAGSKGLVLVVVPKAIGTSFDTGITNRGLHGFQKEQESHVNLYYMNI